MTYVAVIVCCSGRYRCEHRHSDISAAAACRDYLRDRAQSIGVDCHVECVPTAVVSPDAAPLYCLDSRLCDAPGMDLELAVADYVDGRLQELATAVFAALGVRHVPR